MCKVYTGYCGTSEIEHRLCACTVDNPLAKARDYLSLQAHKPCSISHLLVYKKQELTSTFSDSSIAKTFVEFSGIALFCDKSQKGVPPPSAEFWLIKTEVSLYLVTVRLN